MDFADLGPAMSEAYARNLVERAKDKTDKLADRVAALEQRLARIEALLQDKLGG